MTEHEQRRAVRRRIGSGFFILGETIVKDSFNLSKLFHCIFSILFTTSKKFDMSGKSLA